MCARREVTKLSKKGSCQTRRYQQARHCITQLILHNLGLKTIIITLLDRRRGGTYWDAWPAEPGRSSSLQAVFLSVTALNLTISAQASHQWMWCLEVAGAVFEPLQSHFTTVGTQIPFLTSLIAALQLPCKTVTYNQSQQVGTEDEG